MRVGIFFDYIPEAAGGRYTFQTELVRTLAKLQKESGHSFSLFVDERNLRTIETAPEFIGLEKVPYRVSPIAHLLGTLGRRFNVPYLDKVGTLEKTVLRNGIEFFCFLTHAPYAMDIPYLTLVMDLQHRRQPWFPEVSHNLDWQNRESNFNTVLKRAAFIVTGNTAGKNEIQEFYGIHEERIRILPHPTPEFSLLPPNEDIDVLVQHKIGKDHPFVLYPAQFWPHKNHANLLLALKNLRDHYGITLSAVFVGSDKGNLEYLKNLTRELSLEKEVFFAGFVPPDHLALFYKKALALTYMSFFGPENLPPLEAFAFGCPVVASEIAGAREQMGEAVLYVDPKDPQAIALAIKAIYEDQQLRQRLVREGLARSQRWTAQDFVRGIFKILDDFEPIRRTWGKK